MRKSRAAVSAATGGGLLALASLLAFAPAAAKSKRKPTWAGSSSPTIRMCRLRARTSISAETRSVSPISDHDISTLVAFPLPTMEIGEEGNYIFAGNDPVNVMDFQVTVDGKKVEPSVEVRATRFGVDVTDVLKRYNIPLTMAGGDEASAAAYDRLNALPEDAQDILKGYELKYVLTTAENWLGPIGKFKLTVDKTTPDALVSLCAQGIKKAGPTTFVLAEEDLSVLFLEPLKEEN